MNQLLSGGRPISALAKDCCYRDISSLAEDLKRLQCQKSQCEANYDQAMKDQNHALQEIERLKDENGKLSKELASIKDLALSVESEANVSLHTLHKRNLALKLKLNESKRRIQELESNMSSCNEPDFETTNTQIKLLQEQLKSSLNKGIGTEIINS